MRTFLGYLGNALPSSGGRTEVLVGANVGCSGVPIAMTYDVANWTFTDKTGDFFTVFPTCFNGSVGSSGALNMTRLFDVQAGN